MALSVVAMPLAPARSGFASDATSHTASTAVSKISPPEFSHCAQPPKLDQVRHSKNALAPVVTTTPASPTAPETSPNWRDIKLNGSIRASSSQVRPMTRATAALASSTRERREAE